MYAVYMSGEEHQYLLRQNFHNYPNVFIFFSSLTRLTSHIDLQFVHGMLQGGKGTSRAVTALKCLYARHQASAPQSLGGFKLEMNGTILQPFDCLCFSYVISHYPVLILDLTQCHIGDNGAEMLMKHCTTKSTSGHVLQEMILTNIDLTVTGIGYVMKIMRKSKFYNINYTII